MAAGDGAADDDLGGTTPLQLLQDEFASTDQEIRLQAVKRVSVVGEVMGTAATRSELIPEFIDKIDTAADDDEILLALAQELGGFVPIVGGGTHAHLLLPALEGLAAVEETVVREKAVCSIAKVVEGMEGHDDKVGDMVKALSIGDWFTARVSACGAYPSAYAHVKSAEARAQLRAQFEVLSKDETPMVRRSAATSVGDLLLVVEGEYVAGELMVVFKGLCSDDQDNVRMLAVEQCSKVAECLISKGLTAECDAHVLPIVKHALEDRSWRVRRHMARDYARLGQQVGRETTQAELVQGYAGLLQDPETEVRAVAIKHLSAFVDLLGKDVFATQIMPYVQGLVQDINLPVRVALSRSCMDMAPMLGQTATQELVLPMLQTFLRDEAPEVRLHILDRLDAVGPWLKGMAEELMPYVLDLGKNNIWRVRKAVMLAVPLLAETLGAAYFEEHLLDMYLQAYQDSVNEVRLGASQGLQKLCSVCGSDWLLEKVMPRIRTFYDESSFYLIRITVLNALKTLLSPNEDGGGVPMGSTKLLANDVVQLMLKGTQDNIPNVRFSAVQALHNACPHLEEEVVESQVRPCLTLLVDSDTDKDVVYYASMALESMV